MARALVALRLQIVLVHPRNAEIIGRRLSGGRVVDDLDERSHFLFWSSLCFFSSFFCATRLTETMSATTIDNQSLDD
jgi:hypothetical protein